MVFISVFTFFFRLRPLAFVHIVFCVLQSKSMSLLAAKKKRLAQQAAAAEREERLLAEVAKKIEDDPEEIARKEALAGPKPVAKPKGNPFVYMDYSISEGCVRIINVSTEFARYIFDSFSL